MNINAYNQLGVEAGKKAAERILDLQNEISIFLESKLRKPMTCSEIAKGISRTDEVENVEAISKPCPMRAAGLQMRVLGRNLVGRVPSRGAWVGFEKGSVFKICERIAANPQTRLTRTSDSSPFGARHVLPLQ